MNSSIKWLVATGLLLSSGLGAMMVYSRDGHLSEEMTVMTQDNVTHCVGRFLIDLPATTSTSYAPAHISGVVIKKIPYVSREAFDASVKERLSQLASESNEYGNPSLERQEEFRGRGSSGIVAYYGRSKPDYWFEHGVRVEGSEGVNVEAWVAHDTTGYHLYGEQLHAERSSDNARSLATRLMHAEVGEVPTEPGFCIERGIITDPPLSGQRENVTFFFEFRQYPDLKGKLTSTMPAQPPESLIRRMSSKEGISAVDQARISTLREGGRSVNGIAGEEVLESYAEDGGRHTRLFSWEAPGKKGSRDEPTLSLELESEEGGNAVASSLSDDDAVALWDAILESIRLRPGAI
ncbi:T6SS immunity protein Tli4 family protein [Luteimonas sp. RD2P54]|uniref:T6SS immunity protein Tli4 family protein n=1 Tax=Luteimonas endophytica TaxID=3042023 RepID=A0ABT6JAA3_9GAMM|nr:T6SS immunity protein Tli4 family protein [Luteimonas endophytica]MDH5823749.1 T6SS immunity protein Tli4 family protein [Luteimonas endophytica]